METLRQIWKRLYDQGYETDKESVHSYIPVYEKILAHYRETALNVLEIGLFNGASLRMWSEYFTKAKIYGIDCSLIPHDGMADLTPLIRESNLAKVNSNLNKINNPLSNISIHIFDAEDVTEVSRRFFGTKFDVIIEDAGHEINQQLNLYRIWKEYLHPNGVYVVEDIQDVAGDFGKIQNFDGQIIDLRKIKNRYDDVLIVIK